MMFRYGQDLARVSLFLRQGNNKGQKMNDTSGQKCADSSESARLQSSLASKCQAELDVNGSQEYVLTWKRWDMPSGPPICALRARARHKSASGSTGELFGWATAIASDARGTKYFYSGNGVSTKRVLALAGQADLYQKTSGQTIESSSALSWDKLEPMIKAAVESILRIIRR